MEFKSEKSSLIYNREIVKLVCYGFFPWIGSNLIKVFEGPNAHIEFMVWLLSNVTDYTKDSRTNAKFVNVFTFNGSYKELPLLLLALV